MLGKGVCKIAACPPLLWVSVQSNGAGSACTATGEAAPTSHPRQAGEDLVQEITLQDSIQQRI